MDRKAYKHHRNRTRRLFHDWIFKLGLRWYDIQIDYFQDRKSFRNATGASKRAMMKVFPDWRYMHAYIGVCVPTVARVSDEELENAVVHELVHILVNEMQKQDRDHEERAVTLTTKAILFVRDLTAKEFQEKADENST